jgi:hypothetical protein
MVILRLKGGLLLYSPSPAVLDDTTRNELQELGEIRWLVAPNEIHNLGLSAFQQAYPEVHTTGCVGHPRRVHGVRFDVLLDLGCQHNAIPWTANGEVGVHVIGGNRLLHEIALIHHPSKTLIVTDAIEVVDTGHLAGKTPSKVMLWMLRKMGLRPAVPCMSPEHNLFCADAEALAASLRLLESWDFDSIIMSHGRILQGDESHHALHSAFETTIAAVRHRGPVARAFWNMVSRVQ